MEYLKNDICKLKPLFKLDPNTKKNIISCSFFKMNSHYKNFSLYVDGLEKLYYHVRKKLPDYTLRVFIDENINNDKSIMVRLNKLHKMEMVLFNCKEYKDGKYHMGLFASMLRFFPMFDFPNNDANRVIMSDIDDIVLNTLTKYMNKLDKYKTNTELYFIKVGNINKNIYYNYEMNYLNTLSPYSISQMTGSFKRMDHKIIVNYMNDVKENKDNIKYSYYEINNNTKNKFDESYNNFVYGVDEYFINNTLIKYLMDEKLPFSTDTKYEVYGGIFYWVRSLKNQNFSLCEQNIQSLKDIIGKLLGTIGQKYNENISIQDNYKKVDDIIYEGKDGNELSFVLYKIIIESYFDNKYKFVFSNDLYNIILTQEYFGAYEFDKISFFNSTDEDWFSSKKMFTSDQMNTLYVLLNELYKKKITCSP